MTKTLFSAESRPAQRVVSGANSDKQGAKRVASAVAALALAFGLTACSNDSAEEPVVEPTPVPTGEPTETATEDPTETPTVEPTETPTVEPTQDPTEDTTVPGWIDIRVDELVTQLESGATDQFSPDDMFRITAELTNADLWYTGPSGDFFVTIKDPDGDVTLDVIASVGDAQQWQDGTVIQLDLSFTGGPAGESWPEIRSSRFIS